MNKSDLIQKIVGNRRVVSSTEPALVDTIDSVNQYHLSLYTQVRGSLQRTTVVFVVVDEGTPDEAAYMLESGALEDDAVERFLIQRVNAGDYLAYKILSHDDGQNVAEVICYRVENSEITKRIYFVWRVQGQGWQISQMTDHTPQVIPLEVTP